MVDNLESSHHTLLLENGKRKHWNVEPFLNKNKMICENLVLIICLLLENSCTNRQMCPPKSLFRERFTVFKDVPCYKKQYDLLGNISSFTM